MTNSTDQQATDALIALLDVVDDMPRTTELRALSYELLTAGSGKTVVDVGCGAGRAVAELNEAGATSIGVDPDKRMIAVARTRWPKADFRIASAYELPLADASVDGYRADKVFHELPKPSRAIAEARRVLVPRGRIVLVGQDWDTFIIDSDDPALTRIIVQARADLIAAPRAARQYRNLLLHAGFEDVAVEVRTGVFTGPMMLPLLTGLAEGALSAEAVARQDVDRWIGDQRRRAETDRLLVALPIFVAAASAPR